MISKKVVILQSNYIPWKGYFDLMKAADLFVFHDDLQYTRGDWRNRNKIKTKEGLKWLSIPIGNQDNKRINQVKWQSNHWITKHKDIIKNSYRNAPYFSNNFLNTIYDSTNCNYLSKFNQRTIRLLAEKLAIKTPIIDTSELDTLNGTKTTKILSILKAVNASEYISGPAGMNYLNTELFDQAKIKLRYFNYSGYKEYKQVYPGFNHNVTSLDLIFNCGENAKNYLKNT